MTPTRRRLSTKFIAAFVTVAVLLTVPGFPCYEALAQVAVGVGAATTGAVGGQAGAAVAGRLSVDVIDAGGLAPISGIGSGSLAGLRGSPSSQVQPAGATTGFSRSNAAAARSFSAVAGVAPRVGEAARAGVAGPSHGGSIAGGAASAGAIAPRAAGRIFPVAVSGAIAAPAAGEASSSARKEPRPAEPTLGAPTAALLARPEALLRPVARLASMPAAAASEAGRAIMDAVLRRRSAEGGGDAPAPSASLGASSAEGRSSGGGLRPSRPSVAGEVRTSVADSPLVPPAPAGVEKGSGARFAALGAQIRASFRSQAGPGSAGARAKGFVASLLTIGAGAAAVVGAQKGLVLLLPAIFGAMPVAAAWALGSGILIVPAALYTRRRLALRDSPRLKPVKVALDLLLGAYLGSAIIAAPGLWTAAAFASMAKVLPLAFSAQAAHAPLTLGGFIGMLTLPAMTTVAFYLGRIIASAESGRPFGVPGSMQAIRFPTFSWVMTGAVFALLTGFAPYHVNAAFFFWMFLGSRSKQSLADKLTYLAKFNVPLAKAAASLNKIWKHVTFDNAFIAAAAYAALTGFAAPVTFLVLAFAPERAAIWTERFLAKALPESDPAPSSAGGVRPAAEQDQPARWPRLHLWLKNGFFIADLAGLGFIMAATVFGWHAFLVNTAVAAAMAFLPFWFGTKIIKAATKSTTTDEAHDPQIFAAMKDLRARINAQRAAAGKKPIPMPEIVNVPMPVPNAFATGRDPFHALVGVTEPFKAMTLDPENLRMGLVRLVGSAEADLARAATPKALESARRRFAVYRLAAAGSIAGIGPDATPEEVARALRGASEPELAALGERVLRGVLGHEFTHVMERHMLIGSVTGSITSGIAFASYGVMWAVGHAKYMGKKALERVAGRSSGRPPAEAFAPSGPRPRGASEGEVEPEMVEPVTATLALKTVAGLVKVFAALWGPIIAQILQMTISRQDEGLADEGGAVLSEDPEALALGLGLLTTWRPSSPFSFDLHRLPFAAATGHLFTVNPLLQLHEAGALPSPAEEAGKMGRPLEPQDDWLFNLFVTHPDTGVRIERLYEMARARRAGNGPSGPAPRNGGPFARERLRDPAAPDAAPGGRLSLRLPPGHAPPGGLYAANSPAARKTLEFPTPASAVSTVPPDQPQNLSPPQSSGPEPSGLLRKAWRALTSPLRVLPDESRNREFWKFVFGQALIQLGVNFHYTALPNLIAPTKADAARIGYNRAVNWSAQAAASLSTGPMIDRSSIKNMLVWPYLGRSLLLFLVPLVFFNIHLLTGFLPALSFFAAFQAIVFMAGFLQSMGLNAASVAFNRIVAEDADHYNRANAVYNIVLNLVGVVGPLLGGVFISAMLPYYGALSGNALAYGVYGALALAVTVYYGFFLHLPRDEVIAARRALAEKLRKAGGDARVKGVGAERGHGVPVLLVEVSGDPRDIPAGVPAEFQGYKVKVVPERRQLAEVAKGIRMTFKDRFLKLTTIFSTLETMTGDALVFAAVPRLIADRFGLGSAPLAGAAHLPLFGQLVARMPGQGLAFGLILAASSLGLGVSSLPMMSDRDRSGAELEAALSAFRARLGRSEKLGDEVLDAAVEAAHGGVAGILETYRAVWSRDPSIERTPEGFRADVLRAVEESIDRDVFGGRRTPEEMRRLAAATFLERDLGAWSERHFEALMREARTEARTGLNRMERQGRWTSILYGLGAAAYWGVFFSPGIWGSVGWMLASALLQGAATIVWSSLTTRLLQEKYRDDQGKIYSAMSLYGIACSIIGVLVFGALMAALPTAAALWVVGGVMTVVALTHVVEPFVVFPIDRTKVRRKQ